MSDTKQFMVVEAQINLVRAMNYLVHGKPEFNYATCPNREAGAEACRCGFDTAWPERKTMQECIGLNNKELFEAPKPTGEEIEADRKAKKLFGIVKGGAWRSALDGRCFVAFGRGIHDCASGETFEEAFTAALAEKGKPSVSTVDVANRVYDRYAQMSEAL